jgi:hypothetical protein
MSLLTSLNNKDLSLGRFSLNTGTHFDIATGKFIPGKVKNKSTMILNGGLAMTNAITGREQTFKSSVAIGYFVRAIKNYEKSIGVVYDSEISIAGVERVIQLGGADPLPNDPLYDRIELFDKTHADLGQVFKVVQDIARNKEKHRKDLIEETPFIDRHGKFLKAWRPTLVLIDSFSAGEFTKQAEVFEQYTVGDAKTNTVYMGDGNAKTQFMSQLPALAAKGIYFILTAHIGDKIKMDPYAASNKDLPHMRGSDHIKRVGTQFTFQSNNLLETRKVGILQDTNKKCQYPHDSGSPVELQEIISIICRCKNNVSGSIVHHISSQYYGIQEYLEYFNLIKNSKTSLMSGTLTYKLGFGDWEFNRKNIRQLIKDDYEFRRTLEILGQFLYIRNNWNLPEVSSIGYVEFCKKLTEANSKSSDIINSTGIWSFNADKQDRSYMSILDIVALINQK